MTLPEAKPVAILMVEDSPTDAKLIVAELRLAGLSFELERVEDEDGLRAALERREWDLVLCDWFLPKLTAPEVLPILRTLRPDLPFIILSGSVGEQHAVDAMRAGASDYVLKDRLARLAPSIERELRESEARRRQRKLEARFQAVVERSSNAVALTTADGTIAYASPAAGAILGMSPESLLGTRFTDHLSPHDRKLAETPWSGEDASLDRAVTAELRVEARTGPCRWIEATWINKLRDPDIAAIVCNFRDISERRRASEAEAALRQTETQLRHAQKMEAIGRLAGGVAHDFNNILAVILSYTELCLSDLGPSNPSHADMDEVRRAAERGAALTQQLLLFSRQRAVEPVLTDVNEVIGVTEKMLMRILGEDVKTVVVRSHEKAFVRIAPGQLEQILMNLVVNARDAMPTGGMVTIEATTLVLPEEHGLANGVRAGRYVRIAVADNGTGMDGATQAQIFEPFFTTKAPGRGTGLGLSTVFGIVRQAGGDIGVESAPGTGATFKVYLPQVDPEPVVESQGVPLTNLRGSETILVVEDDAAVRAALVTSLRRYGYLVIEAPTPSEALTQCRHHGGRIDLLLTDVVMPGMSGVALAKVFLALRPDAKVVCMSGYTDDSMDEYGLAGAGVAFLEKPLSPASLVTHLRRVLDEPRSDSRGPA